MFTRRELLSRLGTGFGMLGLAGLLADQKLLANGPANPLAPKQPHFTPRAKRIIHVFMNGGPSQVDTFDPKPELVRYHGRPPGGAHANIRGGTRTLMASPYRFRNCGQSGLPVSEIFPRIAEVADELCVIRSMHTNVPNHEPSLLMMTCGDTQPVRPSMGSWLLYGLGCDNQNLPGFIVMCPGKPVVGPQLWSNSFLPGIYQGTHINNKSVDPKTIIRDVQNRYLSPPAQRAQLDLLQQMNQIHLEQRERDEQLEA